MAKELDKKYDTPLNPMFTELKHKEIVAREDAVY